MAVSYTHLDVYKRQLLMYRIVLIDDEPLVLAGIASLIPWEEYELSLIHIFTGVFFGISCIGSVKQNAVGLGNILIAALFIQSIHHAVC